MDAFIVGAAPVHGAEEFYREMLAGSPLVVAADAGAEWCVALGRVPDIAVGDFDSSSAGAVERLRDAGASVIEHPASKDSTDLDLALLSAREAGASSATFTAAFTARLDHTLAALGTLRDAADLAGRIVEPGFDAWLLAEGARESLTLDGRPGMLVSVIALERAGGVCLTGLRYGLQEADLDTMSGLGIGNEMALDVATIRLRAGALLVVCVGSEIGRALERGDAVNVSRGRPSRP